MGLRINKQFKRELKSKIANQLHQAIQHSGRKIGAECYITTTDMHQVLPKVFDCIVRYIHDNYSKFYYAGSNFDENKSLKGTLDKLSDEQLDFILKNNSIEIDSNFSKIAKIGEIISKYETLKTLRDMAIEEWDNLILHI